MGESRIVGGSRDDRRMGQLQTLVGYKIQQLSKAFTSTLFCICVVKRLLKETWLHSLTRRFKILFYVQFANVVVCTCSVLVLAIT